MNETTSHEHPAINQLPKSAGNNRATHLRWFIAITQVKRCSIPPSCVRSQLNFIKFDGKNKTVQETRIATSVS